MTDQCPAGAVLEAFATGGLSDDECTRTEAHLARCLGCAEELERMTRAQLEVLGGARCSIESWPTTTSPVLDQVMRQASEIGSAPTTVSPDWLRVILDTIAAEGRPGSFAGYDVLEIAGRGGMGVVLKARDRTLDRLLARRAEDRFRSATEVASELEQFIRAEHGTRLWVKRAVVGVLGACLALSATVVALDGTGTTAVVNAWLCQRTGDGYYVRGRVGTYSRLPDVVAAANPRDVIEARFSDERLVDSFRLGGKPLTIRAAQGYTPILIATNNAQPLILVDAPLALEGLTLWRRGPVVNFAALISVEKAPLHLLNCRVIRSGHQGQDVLVHGRLRPPTSSSKPPPYRALLAFQYGSVGHVRNCLVVGTPATAFELRASALEPTRIESDNCLFVIDRGFHLNREVETGVTLRSRNSFYFTTVMLDIDQAAITPGISAFWQNCIVDRTRGALIRLNHYGDGARLQALEWRETNMFYAGQGASVSEPHDDPIVSEAQWNEWMQLGSNDHRIIDQQFFPKTTVRSGLTLSAVDLDPQIPKIVRANDSSASGRGPEFIGDGKAYAAFRKDPAYQKWQEQVRASTSHWESGYWPGSTWPRFARSARSRWIVLRETLNRRARADTLGRSDALRRRLMIRCWRASRSVNNRSAQASPVVLPVFALFQDRINLEFSAPPSEWPAIHSIVASTAPTRASATWPKPWAAHVPPVRPPAHASSSSPGSCRTSSSSGPGPSIRSLLEPSINSGTSPRPRVS